MTWRPSKHKGRQPVAAPGHGRRHANKTTGCMAPQQAQRRRVVQRVPNGANCLSHLRIQVVHSTQPAGKQHRHARLHGACGTNRHGGQGGGDAERPRHAQQAQRGGVRSKAAGIRAWQGGSCLQGAWPTGPTQNKCCPQRAPAAGYQLAVGGGAAWMRCTRPRPVSSMEQRPVAADTKGPWRGWCALRDVTRGVQGWLVMLHGARLQAALAAWARVAHPSQPSASIGGKRGASTGAPVSQCASVPSPSPSRTDAPQELRATARKSARRAGGSRGREIGWRHGI